MAVARRAETYIRRESAPRILHLAPRRVNAASGRRTERRLGAGLVDVVDGGARASGLGFMRPSYFASCEPVIPGRAGDLWPRCVPPAPLILPFRPESNFHLSSTPPPLTPSRRAPPSLLRYLNPVVVHAISCTYDRATTGTNQFFSSPRTHPADFAHPLPCPSSFFDSFLFFSFLFSSFFPLYLVGRWRRINDSDRMTCDFSGIGRNNRSETLFRSFRFAAQGSFYSGITRNPEVLFHASLGRAANSRYSASRI